MDGQLIAITEAWFRCVAVPHKNGAVLVWFTDTHWPRHSAPGNRFRPRGRNGKTGLPPEAKTVKRGLGLGLKRETVPF